MAIDNGLSIPERMMKLGYIRTNTQGYTLTKEGLEWLSCALQELYHAIAEIHNELDSCHRSSNASDDITRSDDNRDEI